MVNETVDPLFHSVNVDKSVCIYVELRVGPGNNVPNTNIPILMEEELIRLVRTVSPETPCLKNVRFGSFWANFVGSFSEVFLNAYFSQTLKKLHITLERIVRINGSKYADHVCMVLTAYYLLKCATCAPDK